MLQTHPSVAYLLHPLAVREAAVPDRNTKGYLRNAVGHLQRHRLIWTCVCPTESNKLLGGRGHSCDVGLVPTQGECELDALQAQYSL